MFAFVVFLVTLIPHPQVQAAASQQQPAGQTAYVVGSDDVLRITVFGEAEISGSYTVGSDGTFDFPFVGRVTAGGTTVSGIAEELTRLLADGYLRSPQVTVEIDQYRSQSLFIIGEVRAPGSYVLTGNMTLLEALARAGSTLASAGSELLIIHRPSDGSEARPVLPGEEDAQDVTRVNLADLQTGRLSENVVLQDGDTIFVPKADTFFVSGYVRTPGSYVLQPNMTVLQALALAGGITERGSSRRIKILRIVDGEEEEIDVDMTDIVRPGDTVIVNQRFF